MRKRKRKKYKDVISLKKKKVRVYVVITETINNVFIAIVSLKGKILVKGSSGQMKLQHRHTPLSVELLGKYIGKHLSVRRIPAYGLVVYGCFSKFVKSAIRGLRKYSRKCTKIKLVECIPHNGVRLVLPKRK